MKTLLLKMSSMVVVAVTALALVGTAPVYAQSAPTDSNAISQPQHLDLRQLHDQLNLTPHQEIQWQAALDAMRDSHAAERMNADQMQQRVQTMLSQPIIDLSALHAAHAQAARQDAKLPEQSAQAWIKFYGGLNDQQKTTFSNAMRAEFEEVAHHAARPYDPRTGL